MGEFYAGDAKFNNPEEMRLKKEKEMALMKKIISIIPKPKRYEKIIWMDFHIKIMRKVR